MSNTENTNNTWKSLYRAGGVAPLVALFFYLTEVLAMISGEPYPVTIEEWFSLFQRNKILGLLYLNALDILSIALLGMTFLALYVALKRHSQSYMAIAAFFAFLGIAVFIVPRVALLSVLPLSVQYGTAPTDVQRSQILAAGRALNSFGQATPQTAGFFFLAIAVLIMSIVMLRSSLFSKVTAYVGILASVFTFADDICVLFVPSLAVILMPISGFAWFIWWIQISRSLLKLGRRE